MNELGLYPLEDIVKELKRRDITFLFAWCDHQQFTKQKAFENDIVWGLDSGGNLPIQESLRRFLNSWMDKIINDRTRPGKDENAPD